MLGEVLCFENHTSLRFLLGNLSPDVRSILSASDVQWLNEYHARVWEELKESWPEGALARAWLWEATRPIP